MVYTYLSRSVVIDSGTLVCGAMGCLLSAGWLAVTNVSEPSFLVVHRQVMAGHSKLAVSCCTSVNCFGSKNLHCSFALSSYTTRGVCRCSKEV